MRKNKVAKRAKPVDLVSHQATLIEGMKFSSQEFYARVEGALVDRKIPDINISRVDWKEGGPLSVRREYLRVERERFIFDICAGPFGTGFFVSTWCAEKPLRIGLTLWCVLIVNIFSIYAFIALHQREIYRLLVFEFGLDLEGAIFASLAIVAVIALAVIIIVGSNLDLFLMGVPIIGVVYEKYFRKITYYRTDIMCMYQQAVRSAVTQIVSEITKAQGIAPVSEFEEKPIMRQLQPLGSNGRD